MSGSPAARVTDQTTHMAQPLLPGPGSFDVIIGALPAWRAVPMAAAAAIQSAKATSDATIQSLEATTAAAPDPTSKATAYAAENAGKLAAVSAFQAMLSAVVTPGGTPDIHICSMPAAPTPVPHGPGMVLQGSSTVVINHMPATRVGDKVVEALGPPNPIIKGDFTVMIG